MCFVNDQEDKIRYNNGCSTMYDCVAFVMTAECTDQDGCSEWSRTDHNCLIGGGRC